MPKEKLGRIVFYAGRCIPIHATSLDERPLGGTETGVIRLAQILHSRGHDVTVITSTRTPPENGPEHPHYVPISALPQIKKCSALISVQDWWGVFLPIEAGQRFYWTGDAADQYMTYGMGDRRVAARIDRLLAVSRWQGAHLCRESGYPTEKTAVLHNGVHLPWFEGSEERQPFRLIFASSPYRGLALVPQLYTELKRRIPGAELHLYSGLSVYDRDTPFQGPEKTQYDQLVATLRALPDCFVHGNIPQKELAREYMRSSLLFYPCIFPETSCIVALESLAAGCPVVTSAFAALPETVGKGGLTVAGVPGSPEYMRNFVSAAEQLLANRQTWQDASDAGRTQVLAEHSWERVADRFEGLLEPY